MNASIGKLLISRVTGIRLLPGQVVALAAMGLILLGACFLMLPFATKPGVHLGFIDALFTATSAVCVTGLIVMDTPQDFTVFGLGVILFLIQIGGLGYALMATLILLLLGRRLGLRDRMMLSETMSTMDMQGLVRFAKLVMIITFSLEGIGAVLLTLRFAMDHPWDTATYYGIFHAISAFNNAGFALFSDSLISFQSDWTMNGIITALVILGSIGFLVFEDLLNNFQGTRYRLNTHTKLVIATTGILIGVGTLGIAMLEWNNPATLQPLCHVADTFTVSYFHAVSRTAGFTTIDLGRDARAHTLFLIDSYGHRRITRQHVRRN